MPELPEVEVVCRGLAPLLTGHTIRKISYSDSRLRLPYPLGIASELITGSPVRAIRRRAKFIVVHFTNNCCLIIHLGMTGRLGLFPADTPARKHDHGFWLLDNGMELRFNDTRRFGSIQATVTREETERVFENFGPDPFSPSFCAAYLLDKAKQRKGAIKAFLMDNHVVPGIGNIYASETLFAAGIHPEKHSCDLNPKEWLEIVRQSRRILRAAIKNGGTTIANYVNSSGEKGYFQVKLSVYGRNGMPCKKCGTPVQRSVLCGRATFFCPACQKN
ncbi:MAG: bifunctional DNA-formamidopyrimidine glycosylase/DNA-(apurinic or apyrimidinic site) lyase [Proteobacteria bacterium]|nr:bifunctional DNA-formamidopyrimidine glycosylase/DNA-(apurinic or apyrimidinic site) lyase [Pseudomonadota bacterium]MBU1737545.1 bifunctional DNA-formamidopyrimidine glycosylase/DNA-(apurinic or apyrimidinic site) lyase [Pseudomonadota bacterium]